MGSASTKLAIDGGTPAKTTPNIPMYPGGYEIGEEEKRQVIEALIASDDLEGEDRAAFVRGKLEEIERTNR